MRAIIIVIDSLGVGFSKDAEQYGDVGANTLKSIAPYLNCPTLGSLGLYEFCDLLKGKTDVVARYARLTELSCGKDTTTGHFEIAGIISKIKAPTYPNGFPDEVVTQLEQAFGVGILGNVPASGTKIIESLGEEHIKTKKPIVYTSADSVLQIACHNDVYDLQQLYSMCLKARAIMTGKHEVGRVIARPFITLDGKFVRTGDRKDFGIVPPENNLLNIISKNGLCVAGVGKIMDIFSNSGITHKYFAHGNEQCFIATKKALDEIKNGLIFVNLVDTDMLYGHRNDVIGYANCVNNIDIFLKQVIEMLTDEDLLIITADHGCDPGFVLTTDHTREMTPYLSYKKSYSKGEYLGDILGFNFIANQVLEHLQISQKL